MKNIAFIVAALLSSAAPVLADDIGEEQPSREQSLLIRAFTPAAFADAHCAHYKADASNILKLLEAEKLTPAIIYVKYNAYVVNFTLKLSDEFEGHPTQFCDFLVSSYGPTGVYPDLVERF